MEVPGDIVYKCRNCGKVYPGAHVPDIEKAIAVSICGAENFPQRMVSEYGGIKLLEIHHCSPGSIGVADLIGGKPD